MSNRDDFPKATKRILAQRAGYLCSNPRCRKLTIRPHSEPEKSLSNGVAAHINAASKNGPRYDPGQSEEERSSINNAIWLCHDDSDIVDKDEKTYPAELLREWKEKHEKFIEGGGGLLSLPDICIKTTDGLSIQPTTPIEITGNDVSQFREHILTIENRNGKPLSYLNSLIQFPELILRAEITESPIGTNIRCEPEKPNFVVKATGSGSVKINPGNKPSLNYELEIDKLPAHKRFLIKFISVSHPEPDGYILGFDNDSSTLYMAGELQHEYYGEEIKRKFITKFMYDLNDRHIFSLPCEEYTEDTKAAIRMVF
jgi:hypothetical protein